MDLKRIILILVVLIALGGGYYYFQVYNIAPTQEGGSPIIADIDARLNEIRPLASVELDTSIFNNVYFRSLKVITATSGVEVIPGRTNPFLPF